MPGINERELRHTGGLRNRSVILGGKQDTTLFSDITDPSVLAAGDQLTLLEKINPTLLAPTFTLRTDATVTTRTIELLVVGEDQFGELLTESITITRSENNQAANGLQTYFSEILEVVVVSASNLQAGDSIQLGLNLNAGRWGLPVRLRDINDILGVLKIADDIGIESIPDADLSFNEDLGVMVISGHLLTSNQDGFYSVAIRSEV